MLCRPETYKAQSPTIPLSYPITLYIIPLLCCQYFYKICHINLVQLDKAPKFLLISWQTLYLFPLTMYRYIYSEMVKLFAVVLRLWYLF